MRISDVRVRQVAVPRIYDTYCADPKQLKATIDHGRSTYQIIELTTSDGLTGIGEVSDIAPRMDAPSPATLQDLLSGVLVDTGVPGDAGVLGGAGVPGGAGGPGGAGVLAGGDVRGVPAGATCARGGASMTGSTRRFPATGTPNCGS